MREEFELAPEEFDKAVMEYYLKYGLSCTIKELSEFTGMSKYYIRKTASQNNYRSDDTVKNCINRAGANRLVNAFIPTRKQLRALIINSRQSVTA